MKYNWDDLEWSEYGRETQPGVVVTFLVVNGVIIMFLFLGVLMIKMMGG
jgi:hypothetical protein